MQDHDTPNNNLIPYGYCHCGCGRKTTIAKSSNKKTGLVKGEPLRYAPGHNNNWSPREPRWSEVDKCWLIPLSRGGVAKVDAADLELVSQSRWSLIVAGDLRYSRNGKGERMHRVILSAPRGVMVDHINGDGLDNRRSNLRIATPSQNNQNRKSHRIGESGYRGVVKKKKGKWAAALSVEGRREYYAHSYCPTECAIVRDFAALALHGEFAVLNFPEIVDLFGGLEAFSVDQPMGEGVSVLSLRKLTPWPMSQEDRA